MIVGHGIGVVPTLFALIAQPSFALISIGITWLIALGLIFGTPALRTHQNRWPPSVQGLFIDGYIFKFLLFGLLHAMLMVTVLYADETRYGMMQGIGYALFFAGAVINFVLCFRAVTSTNANPYLVPVLFAAPVFFGTAPTVSMLWLGGGTFGSLAACGRQRSDGRALRRSGDCLLVGTQSQERLNACISDKNPFDHHAHNRVRYQGLHVQISLHPIWLTGRGQYHHSTIGGEMKPLVAILALLITACTSTGVVAVGDDTYMIGKRSAQAGFGPPVKTQGAVYEEANAFCEQQQKELETVKLDVTNSGFGKPGAVSLQFRCK